MAQKKGDAGKKPQTVAENKPEVKKEAAPPKKKQEEGKQGVGHVKQGLGRVKWYNMQKGYGFINLYREYLLDDGCDQILVLKSSILSEPARGLKEREIVDFEIGLALDGKEVAVNLLRISDCYTCGKDGHFQRDCPLNSTTNGNGRSNSGNAKPKPKASINNGEGICYNCKGVGHMARDCESPCRKCNEFGHMPNVCPNMTTDGGGYVKANGNRNGNGVYVRDCFTCGEAGHLARECANPPKRA